MISNINRRAFIFSSLSASLLAIIPFVKINSQEWCPEILLIPNVPFDLTRTLPNGVSRGGIFSVDLERGEALPNGMSLSSDGILLMESFTQQNISGIVFSYQEKNFAKMELRHG